MLPNFIIIGAQKAGTTFLYSILRYHPDIYMSPVKELGFFSKDKLYKRGRSVYEKFFASAPTNVSFVGEATPVYLSKPICPQRIHKLIPDVKMICTFRDPIDRAYSQYLDNRRRLFEYRKFDSLVDDYLANGGEIGTGYFSRGLYSNHIKRYLNYFSPDQFHFLLFENLIKNPEKELEKILIFLGTQFEIDIDHNKSEKNAFSGKDTLLYRLLYSNPNSLKHIPHSIKKIIFKMGKPIVYTKQPMDRFTINKLSNYYQDYNAELKSLTRLDLSEWK